MLGPRCEILLLYSPGLASVLGRVGRLRLVVTIGVVGILSVKNIEVVSRNFGTTTVERRREDVTFFSLPEGSGWLTVLSAFLKVATHFVFIFSIFSYFFIFFIFLSFCTQFSLFLLFYSLSFHSLLFPFFFSFLLFTISLPFFFFISYSSLNFAQRIGYSLGKLTDRGCHLEDWTCSLGATVSLTRHQHPPSSLMQEPRIICFWPRNENPEKM